MVGAGGAASVTFSNIGQQFAHLQLRCFGRTDYSVSNAALQLRFNGDSGTNYAIHNLYGDGSSAGSLGGALVNVNNVGDLPNPSALSNSYGISIIDILDFNNTNKFKTVRSLSGMELNGSGIVRLYSGLWQNTSVITSITFISGGGANLSSNSRFDLYGFNTSPATGA